MSITKKEKVSAVLVAVLASARVVFERLKRNKTVCKAFRIFCVCLLAVLAIFAYTAIITRHAANEAVEKYKATLAEQQAEEEEAQRLANLSDPYTLLLEEEATLGAKALDGVKLFNYDDANKKTILQGIVNRVLDPRYPDTVEDVLEQNGQFDFFSESNSVTEENYRLCYAFFDAYHKQERLPCPFDLVFIELGDKVTLRNTLEKTYETETWWYGK